MIAPALQLGRAFFHGVSVQGRPEVVAWLEAAGLGASAPDWHACDAGDKIAFDGKVMVRRLAAGPDHPALYLKIYDHRRESRHFFCRRSKAYLEVTGMLELKRLGIPTLEVLAWGERRRFGGLIEAFIVTVDADCLGSLRDIAKQDFPSLSPEAKAARIDAIGRLLLPQVRRAHDAGFFHRDLKWRNLLLRRDGDAETLIWMDCPRRRLGWWGRFRPAHSRLVDLADLAKPALKELSRSQRWRFLRRYLGDSDASRPQAKQLWRDIARRLIDKN